MSTQEKEVAESTETVDSATDAKGRVRNTYTLQEKLDVIDYLRARPEPVVGKTKVEIAAIVAEATGIQHLTAGALWNIIETAPKANLVTKVALIAEESTEGLTQKVEGLRQGLQAVIDMQNILTETLKGMSGGESGAAGVLAVGAVDSILGRLELIEASISTIEDKSKKAYSAVGRDIESLKNSVADLALKFSTFDRTGTKVGGGV